MNATTLFAPRRPRGNRQTSEPVTPDYLRARHPELLEALGSILRHPRSLARPLSSWRPPTKTLPPTPGGPELTVALSRHRVGPRVKARIRGWGEKRTPAYLVSARITEPTGAAPSQQVAEAWIRALVGDGVDEAVHEIASRTAITYVWVTDAAYRPISSPASLFAGLFAA